MKNSRIYSVFKYSFGPQRLSKLKMSFLSRALFLLFIAISINGFAQETSTAQRDGQHDFDFNIGIWKTHISMLVKPLTGSKTWNELNGIVTVRKVWDGRAQVEEIEADGAS